MLNAYLGLIFLVKFCHPHLVVCAGSRFSIFICGLDFRWFVAVAVMRVPQDGRLDPDNSRFAMAGGRRPQPEN
jgi:hypothetical protein